MAMQNPPFYALLVGIDHYINTIELPTLGGCENDVQAMADLLRTDFGVPDDPAHIRLLTNANATHVAIEQAFRDHLIAAAKSWKDAGSQEPAPAFLFHFSGHGAQAVDETGTEPDGMDETICPHDSRTEGVFDIKDWELDALLQVLSEHTDNVTVILDSCHSGSGTRLARRSSLQVRRGLPDMRPQPTHRPAVAQARGMVGPSDWLTSGRHVLIAGCHDRELSNEYTPPNNGRQHGALSYFLLEQLASMPRDRPVTYRDVYQPVRSAVTRIFPDQVPQCEGDLDRTVFGSLRPIRDVFFAVTEKKDGFIWVDGGAVHGMTTGAVLSVYPDDTQTIETASEPIGTLVIEELEAVRSGCVLADGSPDVTSPAKAVVSRLSVDMHRRITLSISDAELKEAVEGRVRENDLASYAVLVGDSTEADFQIALADGSLVIQDAAGTPLVAPFETTKLDEVASDLKHLIRYLNTRELKNPGAGSSLAEAVSLTVRKLNLDGAEPSSIPLDTTPGGEPYVEVGEKVVLEIANLGDRDLNFTVIGFAADWEIYQVYPRKGAHELLHSGKTFSVGLTRNASEQLEAAFPIDSAESYVEVRETFKVIASVAESDFSSLEQKPLKSPFQNRARRSVAEERTRSALEQLLDQAMEGGATRKFGAPKSNVEDDWTTSSAEVLVTRPPESEQASARLQGGKAAALVAFGIEMTAPDGFDGAFRVVTERQRTRQSNGDTADLQPPPGIAGYEDLLEPFSIAPSRSIGATGALIEIDAEPASLHRITPSQPLVIRLPAGTRSSGSGGNSPLLAVAHDGQFFYPVGRSGEDASRVEIEWLPDPQGDESTGRRGLGRLVKLYLFKVLGKEEPTLGLHEVEFVATEDVASTPATGEDRIQRVAGGEVRYRRPNKDNFASGQQVALVVHGFQSDTWGTVGRLSQIFAENAGTYDHMIAFDYETFGTAVLDNADTLANELRELGFAAGDNRHLDVFAHSMGTLVSRAMIEVKGGNTFVERAFFAGPPNLGTELARLKKLVTWIMTLLLNKAGPNPPALIASWALKRVSDDAVGVQDLHPSESVVLAALKNTGPIGVVPYYILAGTNIVSIDGNGVWGRLASLIFRGVDAILDQFFDSQNDLIIGLDSMRGLDGVYPASRLQTEVVSCDHFGYYHTDQSLEHLKSWLAIQP